MLILATSVPDFERYFLPWPPCCRAFAVGGVVLDPASTERAKIGLRAIACIGRRFIRVLPRLALMASSNGVPVPQGLTFPTCHSPQSRIRLSSPGLSSGSDNHAADAAARRTGILFAIYSETPPRFGCMLTTISCATPAVPCCWHSTASAARRRAQFSPRPSTSSTLHA